jgi:hypothetical protein
MRPAADWEKLAAIVEPEPGPITAQLEDGVPMLLSAHSLGAMLEESAIDSQRSIQDEEEMLAYSQELLEDLEDMELGAEEAAAKVLEEGGTVKVR